MVDWKPSESIVDIGSALVDKLMFTRGENLQCHLVKNVLFMYYSEVLFKFFRTN